MVSCRRGPRHTHPELARGAAPRHGATAGKLPLVGVLEPGPQQPPRGCLQGFQQGLRDLGDVEGHNIRFAYRYAEDHADRLPSLPAELVQLAPDLIWLHLTQAVVAARRATTTIPIVIGLASDLLERGLVASLALAWGEPYRPGFTAALTSWPNSSKR